MPLSLHIFDGRAKQDRNIVVSISYYDSERRDGFIQDHLCCLIADNKVMIANDSDGIFGNKYIKK